MKSDGLKINYRAADINTDLKAIVSLHISAFPRFFLTAMGEGFVRHYYQSVLDFSDNISLVAIEQDKIVGFITGFGQPQDFYAFYKQQKWRLVPLVILAVLRQPKLLRRVLWNFRRVSHVNSLSSEVELSSIAVASYCQGQGIGRSLIDSFFEVARQGGYQSVYLTTDTQENDRTNQFYLEQGFTLEETFLSDNRQMNRYRKFLK